MADLVRGRYSVTSPMWTLLGQTTNSTQPNIAVRTNVTAINGLADTAAALATGVCTSVAVPVEYGDVISTVRVAVGATAAGTPTNSWAAVYSGIATPALLAQSTTGGSGAIAASGVYTFTLATPVTVTPAIAPNGFIYVSVMVAATTVPSLATIPAAAAVGYKWFTNSPLFFAASHGSALTTTAPATIAAPTALGTAPVVVLA